MTDTEKSIRLMAEWEPQDAVIITWPHQDSDWQKTIETAETCYTEIARTILNRQPLLIVVRDKTHLEHVRQLIRPTAIAPQYVLMQTNDTWIRDYGPLSIQIGQQTRLIDFRFNAWGNKYSSQLDDRVSEVIQEGGFIQNMKSSSLILEGGAIETDGNGTLLATRGSVISKTRNSGMDQLTIERKLAIELGLNLFHWIDCDGLEGDDTDGHIDTLARFIDEKTILYATVTREHPDYAIMESLAEQLSTLRMPDGSPYRLLPLPPPPLRYSTLDGRLLPATYANFLIINEAILLPVYTDENDMIAIQTLSSCSERKVVPINCNALIEQNGSLHCATMQLARGTTNFGITS